MSAPSSTRTTAATARAAARWPRRLPGRLRPRDVRQLPRTDPVLDAAVPPPRWSGSPRTRPSSGGERRPSSSSSSSNRLAWALYALFRPVHAGSRFSPDGSGWATPSCSASPSFPLPADASRRRRPGVGPCRGGGTRLPVAARLRVHLGRGAGGIGLHLVLIGRLFIASAGTSTGPGLAAHGRRPAYLTDTVAHLVIADYAAYADLFLATVALPLIAASSPSPSGCCGSAWGGRPPTAPSAVPQALAPLVAPDWTGFRDPAVGAWATPQFATAPPTAPRSSPYAAGRGTRASAARAPAPSPPRRDRRASCR